jgi:hypothetical protein
VDVRTVLAPPRRRLLLAAALVVVALLAVTAVQVRAQTAQEARERAAAVEQAEQAEQERREQERREEERRAAEERRLEAARAEAAAAQERAEAWAGAAEAAEAEHGAGTALLADTDGAVVDDAVREALATALATLRGRLDAGDTDDGAAAALEAGVADARGAAQAVAEAHAAWAEARAEEERVAAEARAAADAAAAERGARADAPAPSGDPGAGPRPPTSGAGPDCGSPASWEPPTQPVAFMTSTPSVTGDGSNGRVPRSRMAALPWCVDAEGNAQWLRADAAAAMIRLNEAFRARFGENIAIDMSYRSYEQQVAMREYYGSIAARPGTSNHGWGTAIDTWEWQAYAFGSERYEWLVANGPAYGWIAPSWARQDGSNPEYWHFEYTG